MHGNRRGRPKTAVGYIRVSTQGQADDGFGLEFQRDRILSYAKENGYVLNMIYQDIISGNDRKAMKDRPDLKVAVQEAKRIRGVIIVARMDRVSRSKMRFLEFCQAEKVRIVSTVPGETDNRASSQAAVARAENVRRNIADGTKRSLGAKNSIGISLGNPSTLPSAVKSSSKARSVASHMKVLEIRDFLLLYPESRSKTAAAIADLLNQTRIRSGWNRPWTKSSLRRQLRRAFEELKLLEEQD